MLKPLLMRILLIDNSKEIFAFVRYCLSLTWPYAELEHYPPACGKSGLEFDWCRYDLLLLDYQSALMDPEGLSRLRDLKRYRDAPVTLLLSPYANEKTAIQASQLGADYCFNKNDLSPERFTAAITEILEKIRDHTRDPIHKSKEPISDAGSRPIGYAPAATPSTTRPRGHVPIPIRVPGYENLRQIARGGMASIYLAARSEDRLPVILKILPLAENTNPNLLKRFMREYNLLSQLHHPHVANIYERGFASDFAYIAIEYFPAGDLKHRLRKTLSTQQATYYLRQIAHGLSAVHAMDIVHRDLKPANILFRGNETLAISDFGVAKHLATREILTQDNAFVGTLYYISPEQIHDRRVDRRSDLYSLGVILFEMLTGTKPFHGNAVSELFRAHLSAPIPQLPPELTVYQPVIDGLLAKDPDDRFQTTEELLAGLDWIESRGDA